MKSNTYSLFKRPLEYFLTIVFSPVWLTLFGVIYLLVRIKMGSPVLFTQTRGGFGGEIFKLYKFRTMLDTRDQNGQLLSDEKRLTPFGRWLRATSLDELPSLFNVLKGEMALVGPRPFISKYLPLYNERQKRRHEVYPGITGWAQVNGRNAINWNDKFELDVWYVDNMSIWVDIRIVFLTMKKVFMKEGIDSSATITMEEFKGNV